MTLWYGYPKNGYFYAEGVQTSTTLGSKFLVTVLLNKGAAYLDPMNQCTLVPYTDDTKIQLDCVCLFSVKTATIKRCNFLFEAYDYIWTSAGYSTYTL
jgi:hypothetical protein